VHGRRQLNSFLSIGDLLVEVTGPGAELVPEDLRPFVAEPNRPIDFTCQSRPGPVAAVDDEDLLFDSGGVWKFGRSDDGFRLVLHAEGRPYHALELNAELDRAVAVLDSEFLPAEETRFPLRAPIHELWTSFLLMRGRGLLLHACGWLVDDRVHIFAGQSGAGKSTLAGVLNKSGRGQILSDDRLILRPTGRGGFRVFGTPWHGELQHALPRSGKVASIDFLAKAKEPKRNPMGKALAAARLTSVCFLAGWPRRDLAQVLDTCAQVVAAVPMAELAFAPDQSVMRVLDDEN